MDKDSLEYFFQAYFHRDWMEDYSSYEALIRDFLEEPPLLVEKLKQALIELRSSESSMDEGIILDLGGEVMPSLNGQSCREWLDLIIQLINAGQKNPLSLQGDFPGFQTKPEPYSLSSFPDFEMANQAVGEALLVNHFIIKAWLAGLHKRLPIFVNTSYVTGRWMEKNLKVAYDVKGVFVLLTRHLNAPKGFLIYTTYPKPYPLQRIDTTTLKYFFQMCFHQDWVACFSSEENAVKHFMKEKPQTIEKTRLALIELKSSDVSLNKDVVYALGGGIVPRLNDYSCREWLAYIIELVSDGQARQKRHG